MAHEAESARNHAADLAPEERDNILENFQAFQDYLGQKVQQGERLGLSENALAKAAERVADYLADQEEPRNREEHLLKQLWINAEEEDKRPLARTLVKLADAANK